jgi:hypothetical protein
MKIVAAALVTGGNEILFEEIFETNGTTIVFLHLIHVHMRQENILIGPSTLT